MKKFISMVMAAAMVVSLVPATAFAADATATAKIVGSDSVTKTQAERAEKGYAGTNGIKDAGVKPEVQIKVTSADFTKAEVTAGVETEITLTLDNAEWITTNKDALETKIEAAVKVTDDDKTAPAVNAPYTPTGDPAAVNTAELSIKDIEDDEVTLVFKAAGKAFEKDDKIAIDLSELVVLTKVSTGTEATVTVDSDDLGLATDALTFVSVESEGIKAKIKKTVDVAPEEMVVIKDIKIEPAVGSTMGAVVENGDTLKLKLSKGFEFVDTSAVAAPANPATFNYDGTATPAWTISTGSYDDDVIEFGASSDNAKAAESWTLKDLKIEATDAKVGDVATITVKVGNNDSVKLEVAKVVEEGIVIELADEDEDVPVMWSGVNAKNTGLTADDDEHDSLEVTFKESFPGSLGEKDEFELTLPEGVWVTDVKITDVTAGGATFAYNNINKAFEKAYQEGDHESFKFGRRDFITEKSTTDEIEFTMQFTLVADPGFEGDVTLTVSGDAFEGEAELVIAKFVSPWTVEAQSNDLIIDYRNTAVPTSIVVKEAEAGLWKKGAFDLGLGLDRYIDFEDDATFEVNEESGMEIDDDTVKVAGEDYKCLFFEVDEESDDEAAVITISDISLYMSRNIAAGPYDLEIVSSKAITEFEKQTLFAPDCGDANCDGTTDAGCKKDNDCIVDDVTDYSSVVKEGFVNVITAGRDQDDASFTKKVVVPVGESYIIAGEAQVTLDVPAYISAAGYTMLPVRAVATALGVNNNNVIWDQATKTVTIMYGQRIITMTAGQKVIYVNGSAIPACSAVEIKDGRTFVVLRDLATALGVTDVSWDPTTKTATLNGGNQK